MDDFEVHCFGRGSPEYCDVYFFHFKIILYFQAS